MTTDPTLHLTWDDIDRWGALLNNLPIALIATDAVGTVEVWNQHAADLYGWPADEAIGRAIQDLTVGPQDHQIAHAIMGKVAAGGVWEGDFAAARRDGSSIDIHVIDAPIFGYRSGAARGGPSDDIDTNTIVGIVGLSVDVSAGREEIKNSLRVVRDASLRSLVEVDVERRRIAMAIHDEIGQVLTALRSELHWLHERPADEHDAIIGRLHQLVDSGIESVRRVCEDLRPRQLHELGLEASLRNMALEVARRIGADTELRIDDLPLLSPPAAITLYRTAQECITNIERHAPTSALISIDLHIADASARLGGAVVVLQVTCDGGDYRGQRGYGISAMHNRIAALGGALTIEGLPGGGTTVTAQLAADVSIAPEPQPDGPPIEYRGHEWHIANTTR